jgi:hypothetical protein
MRSASHCNCGISGVLSGLDEILAAIDEASTLVGGDTTSAYSGSLSKVGNNSIQAPQTCDVGSDLTSENPSSRASGRKCCAQRPAATCSGMPKAAGRYEA